jgi:hypothetical protein
VEYPIDVDDEYWETGDPETSFKQPEGVPSKLSYFVSILKLCRIIGEVLKTVVRWPRVAFPVAFDSSAILIFEFFGGEPGSTP